MTDHLLMIHQGLNGETAISVRLYLPDEESESAVEPTTAKSGTEVGQEDSHKEQSASSPANPAIASATSSLSMPEVIRGYVVPPRGSFRHHCNVCKQPYTQMHSFYHQVLLPLLFLSLLDIFQLLINI